MTQSAKSISAVFILSLMENHTLTRGGKNDPNFFVDFFFQCNILSSINISMIKFKTKILN